MTTLFTVNKSPFERNALATCLTHTSEGDAVLMIEDGVLGARKGTAFEKTLRDKRPQCAIYALGPDLAARGVKAEDLVAGVEIVDYGGFVDLAARNDRVCAWL